MIVSVRWLADAPHLISAVGAMRWAEWGHAPEPANLDFWIDATEREAGHIDLPVTWVATDELDRVLGAVALGEFDIDERRDRSPCVLGMIVHASLRRSGVGRTLMNSLHAWAGNQGIAVVWVATEQAAGFYEKCGWQLTEVFSRQSGELISILRRSM